MNTYSHTNENIVFYGDPEFFITVAEAQDSYDTDPTQADEILKDMGIDPAAVSDFGIGWDEAAGTVIIPYPGTDYYTAFDARGNEIIIPVPDHKHRPAFIAGEGDGDAWTWVPDIRDALASWQSGERHIITGTHQPHILGPVLEETGAKKLTVVVPDDECADMYTDGITKAADIDVQVNDLPKGQTLHTVLNEKPHWLDTIHPRTNAPDSAILKKEAAAEPQADAAPINAPTSKFGPTIGGYIGSDDYERETRSFKALEGVSTGFKGLDDKLKLMPGLAILGGAPSTGKTTWCEQLMLNLYDQGQSVMVFAGEQTQKQLVDKITTMRYIQGQSKYQIPGHLTNTQIAYGASDDLLKRVREDMKADFVDHRFATPHTDCDTKISEIIDTIKEYIDTTGCRPFVLVDYLQLLTAAEGEQIVAVTAAVNQLWKLAHEKDIWILLISSLGRVSYYDRVTMTSYKESGNIEYRADYLLGLELAITEQESYLKLSPEERRKAASEEKTRLHRRIMLTCMKQRLGTAEFQFGLSYDVAHDFFTPDPDVESKVAYDLGDLLPEQKKSRKRV